MNLFRLLCAACWACLLVVLLGSTAQASTTDTATISCGTVDRPCVVELGAASVTAVGVLGLAGVLVGGVRIAQGLRR